jgi:hypothetical protein
MIFVILLRFSEYMDTKVLYTEHWNLLSFDSDKL